MNKLIKIGKDLINALRYADKFDPLEAADHLSEAIAEAELQTQQVFYMGTTYANIDVAAFDLGYSNDELLKELLDVNNTDCCFMEKDDGSLGALLRTQVLKKMFAPRVTKYDELIELVSHFLDKAKFDKTGDVIIHECDIVEGETFEDRLRAALGKAKGLQASSAAETAFPIHGVMVSDTGESVEITMNSLDDEPEEVVPNSNTPFTDALEKRRKEAVRKSLPLTAEDRFSNFVEMNALVPLECNLGTIHFEDASGYWGDGKLLVTFESISADPDDEDSIKRVLVHLPTYITNSLESFFGVHLYSQDGIDVMSNVASRFIGINIATALNAYFGLVDVRNIRYRV